MLFLIIFAFIGGLVTVLSPCILPLLPIILSSSTGGKAKPFGIITGFIASFTFFTLFLNTIVKLTGISADSLRNVSIFVIAFFGITLLIPQTQKLLEKFFSYFARFTPNSSNRSGFWGGILIGLSIGLLWTPCVGPILASVITLAVTGSVNTQAFLITLSFSIGTAIPMLIILRNGNQALNNVPWLVRNTNLIQKVFGVLMILTALAIFFNVDRKFQSFILDKFPQYGSGLTSVEDNAFVREALKGVNGGTNIMPASPEAPELIPDGEWFNSEPLTISGLKGKVVLVDFWTYSCINCIRTLPYLASWYEKYEKDGLVIIGVHTPEFEFEKDPDNVAKAIEDFKIKYPVVQDNLYRTWSAYGNQYWPAKYLIDKDGLVRYVHFGEGKYDETEKMIQTLLSETGKTINEKIDNADYKNEANTAETYLGYGRLPGTANNEKITRDEFADYTAMENTPLGYPAFTGSWKISKEYSEAGKGAGLVFGFESKNVFLVMRSEKEANVKIMLDGKEVGTVAVQDDKLYDIVKLDTPGVHVLYLQFDEGIEVYAFTFG